jgi:hypothetical protein
MENLLVLLIVFAAAVGCGVGFLRKRKKGGSSCASGCGGCSCAAKPAATPLVTLRR